MILFRCSSCGQAYRVEAKYKGGSAECQICGSRAPIPETSDPGVFLIYRAGDPEEGRPMSEEDIQKHYAEGALASTDLIWQQNSWYPLGDVFKEADSAGEGLLLPQKVGLGLKLAAAGDKPEETLSELPALPTVPVPAKPAVAVAPVAEPKRRAGAWAFWRKWRRRPPASEPAAGGAPAGPSTPQPKWRRITLRVGQVVAAFLAVWLGFKCGVGPLVSQARKRPTYVLVHNHEDVEYVARLGWRRLIQELSARSVCQFDLYVGMPETQTLILIPGDKTRKRTKLRIPLRPGYIVLVNVDRKGAYSLLDAAAVKGLSIGSDAVKALASQLAQNKEPAAVVEMLPKLVEFNKKAYKGTTNELLLDDRQYQMGSFAAGAVKLDHASTRPVLVFGPVWRLEFADGWSMHTMADAEKAEGAVRLPQTTVKLPMTLSPVIPANRDAVFRRAGNRVELSVSQMPQKVTCEGIGFDGNWQYSAAWAPGAGGKPAWSWTWTFNGYGADKDKKMRRVNIRVSGQADPTYKIE